MGTALLAATSLSRGHQMVIYLMAAGLVVDVLLVSAALCLRARLYAQLLDECSGTLNAGIAQSFELSPLAGVPVLLKEAPCLRCHACVTETLRGDIISAVLSDLKSYFLRTTGAGPSRRAARPMYTRYSTMILDEELCASLELSARIPYKHFPHLEHCWTTSTTELAKEP